METSGDKPTAVEEESAALEQSDADAAQAKGHKKPKGKKKSHPKHVAKEPEVLAIGPKQYDFVVLPEDENDPHWDPKLRNPVPEGLVDGLAEFGWDESSQAVAIRE